MRKDIYDDVTFFFTMVTKGRKPFFHDYDLCELLMLGVEITQTYLDFGVEAYCVLPDHIHLLISLPDGVYTYSNILQNLRFAITTLFRFHFNKPGLSIWQDKYYSHTIRSPFDLQTHFDFIHYDPIHHGYVDSIDKWLWSSFDPELDDEGIKTRLKYIDELNQRGYLVAE